MLDWRFMITALLILNLGFLTYIVNLFMQNEFIFYPYTLQNSTCSIHRGVVLSESLWEYEKEKEAKLFSKFNTFASKISLCEKWKHGLRQYGFYMIYKMTSLLVWK
jgi:hypothetical protein